MSNEHRSNKDQTISGVNFSDLVQAELIPLIIREIKLHPVPTVSFHVEREERDIQEQEQNVPQFLAINLEPEINDVEDKVQLMVSDNRNQKNEFVFYWLESFVGNVEKDYCNVSKDRKYFGSQWE